MLSHEDIRKKLLAQRRDLFRQAAQTEEELLWFESDIESEVEERGQEESMVRLLDRLDGRAKAEIEAIDRALCTAGHRSVRPVCGDAERPSPSPGWRHSQRQQRVYRAHRRRRLVRR